MKLSYYLTKMYLAGCEDKYRAQISKQEVLTRTALATRMANKNTAFSAADISGIFELMQACIIEAIEEGYAVDSVMGMLKYSIQGSFDNVEDGFDSSRHKVKAYITLNNEYLDTVNNIHVEKVTASITGPNITIIKDGTDDNAEADTLTVGGIVKIIGENLKIAESPEGSTDHGIYFIANDGTETKVELMIENNRSKLIMIVPATLTVGNYNLEVRTYARKSTISKQLTKCSYDTTINVII